MPVRANANPTFNLADLFELVAAAVPERTALVRGDQRESYRSLDQRTARLASALHELGLHAGSHVGLFLFDTIAHVEAMLACYKARLVPININHRYTATELAYLVDNADLAALVFEPALSATAAAARSLSATAPLMIAGGDATSPPRGAAAIGGDAPDLQQLIAAHPPRQLDPRSGDDPYVLYTGGTTGMPKGVVWRQEDIFFTVMGGGNPGGPPIETPEQIAEAAPINRAHRIRPFLPPGDPGPDHFVGMGLGPLMHASGNWSTLGALLGGGTAVLYDRPHMDMERVLDLIERESVAALNLIGDANARPLLAALRRFPDRWDTSSLRMLGSGGAMLSGEIKDGLLAALPSLLVILEGLGSSECPAQATAISTRHAGPARSLTFKARPETILVDDDLRPIPPGSGSVGRLATRGRGPLGYYKDPQRTASTFVEIEGKRWTLPGDMATIDADGTVRLIGRGSQCINSGGEKIYPAEVEAVLVAHPKVADVVIVGIADDRWGERVAAVVVAVDPAAPPTLEDLQILARDHLAGYKIPRVLTLVERIRRSPAGKADYAWARAAAGS